MQNEPTPQVKTPVRIRMNRETLRRSRKVKLNNRKRHNPKALASRREYNRLKAKNARLQQRAWLTEPR